MSILTDVLPTVLRILNFILDKSGATIDERRAVTELIMASGNESKSGIETKDEYASLRDRLKARLEAEKKAKA